MLSLSHSEVRNFRDGRQRNCRKSFAHRWHGMTVHNMNLLKAFVVVVSLATVLLACPFSVSCPADHAEMHRVGEDNSGPAHLVVFEHQTSAGETHQVSIRCER